VRDVTTNPQTERLCVVGKVFFEPFQRFSAFFRSPKLVGANFGGKQQKKYEEMCFHG